MNAFARAAAALHRDANLSAACTWAPGWDRDWPRALVLDLDAMTATISAEAVALRGVVTQPTDGAFGTGSLGAMAQSLTLDVATADLSAAVLRGDFVTIGGDTYKVESPSVDVEGVTWRLVLSETE